MQFLYQFYLDDNSKPIAEMLEDTFMRFQAGDIVNLARTANHFAFGAHYQVESVIYQIAQDRSEGYERSVRVIIQLKNISGA